MWCWSVADDPDDPFFDGPVTCNDTVETLSNITNQNSDIASTSVEIESITIPISDGVPGNGHGKDISVGLIKPGTAENDDLVDVTHGVWVKRK